MRYFKNPKWSKRIYPEAIWDFSFKDEPSIYLTFDDGPEPEVTPFVLDTLAKHNAKATFFCLGEQVAKYPALFKKIIQNGHAIGSHGMKHLNGLKTETAIYVDNVLKACDLIDSKLFRPPYGKITPAQFKSIRKEGFDVVFWSAMAYDFDETLSSEKRLSKMKKLTKKGAIFVFHDNLSSFESLKTDLPELMEFWQNNHFTFKTV